MTDQFSAHLRTSQSSASLNTQQVTGKTFHKVRFGNGAPAKPDEAKLNSDLPEWTKAVKDPAITLESLREETKKDQEEFKKLQKDLKEQKEKEQAAKKSSSSDYVNKDKTTQPGKNMFAMGISQWVKNRNNQKTLDRVLGKDVLEYLPEEVKNRLSPWRKANPKYWYERLFNNGELKRREVTLQGAQAIKIKQTWVQAKLGSDVPSWESYVKDIEGFQKNKDSWKEFTETYLPSPFNKVVNMLGPVILPLAKSYFNGKIASVRIYEPLLDEVPLLPDKFFEKQLKGLEDAYEKQYPNDKLKKPGKALKSGSVGQVYLYETEKGQKLIAKVLRPDSNPKFFDESKKLEYFLEMLKYGTSPEAKKKAVAEVEATVNTLKQEINFHQEAQNAKLAQQTLDEFGIQSINIPKVLTVTSEGMFQTFAPGVTLRKAPPADKEAMQIRTTEDFAVATLLGENFTLDGHGGNWMTEGTSKTDSMIDLGRFAILTPQINKARLKLLAAVYSSPLGGDTLTPNVLTALKELLLLGKDSEEKKLFLKSTETCLEAALLIEEYEQLGMKCPKTDQENARFDEVQNALGKLKSPYEECQAISTLLTKLFKMKEKSLEARMMETGDMKQVARQERIRSALGTSEKSDDQDTVLHSGDLALFSLWSNFVQINQSPKSATALPSLSTLPISNKDLDTVQTKFVGFTRDYFFTELPSDEDLAKTLSTIDIETFKENAAFERTDWFIEDNLAEDLVQAVRTFDASRSTEDKEAAQKDFTTAINNLLNAKQKRKILLKLYRVNSRCKSLANRLTNELVKKTGMTLKDHEIKRLKQNIETGLRNEFDLTARDIKRYLDIPDEDNIMAKLLRL